MVMVILFDGDGDSVRVSGGGGDVLVRMKQGWQW